jgi:translation initiation factor 2B subunit (eIF-2B alpha/beta/delta family)/8-oxo-dGTP pyrophosphatase MutT (NUDIX family)
MEFKHVVTSFIQHEHDLLLLRRSAKVGSYQGRWAAVSGFIEGDEDPLQRARTEIQEELGLGSDRTRLERAGEPLRAYDEEKDKVWIVHPFLFELDQRTLSLDWEHTEYKWIKPNDLVFYDTFPKLKEALERVRWDLTITPTLHQAERQVNELANDRTHGASQLGRKSLEIVADVVSNSSANSVDDLFCDLVSVVLRLRKAQPNMATVRNLPAKLLYEIDATRKDATSPAQFKDAVRTLAQRAVADAESAAEDAARNSIALLPEEGNVLTHSYSSTARRTFELGMKSRRNIMVYVTESSPGMEGKQLAKDLISIGLPVKMIADSAVKSIIQDIDTVLVGADSVLNDGSIINKVGTNKIAEAAYERHVPFYVVCEKAKFSTMDFLGERGEISKTLFDVTPSDHVSRIVTETGAIGIKQVEQQIKSMLRQLYP